MENKNFLSPVCFRLTLDERQRLEHDAGNMPISAYVRSRLFDPGQSRPRHRGIRPVKDQEVLGQLLAGLGQAHIANNLNQLAKAVNSGSLPVCPETDKEIHEAYEHINWIRRMLIKALALQPEDTL